MESIYEKFTAIREILNSISEEDFEEALSNARASYTTVIETKISQLSGTIIHSSSPIKEISQLGFVQIKLLAGLIAVKELYAQETDIVKKLCPDTMPENGEPDETAGLAKESDDLASEPIKEELTDEPINAEKSE